MEIITVRRHSSGNAEPGPDIYGNSPDREYMEQCAQVDKAPPPTWEKYDMTSPAGVKKVIEMEYKELMGAATESETVENIYHLSVALLRLWRLHHDTNAHGTGH